MDRSDQPLREHAYSRYGCVTERLIDALQQDYFAGREPGASISMDATAAAIIVAESLEADRLWETLPERLTRRAARVPHTEGLSDWTLATLSELFLEVADFARSQGDQVRQRDYWALAWALLEEVTKSPTASPMLWYEDIYFDLGQELRIRREPEAIDFLKRALAHDLHYGEGGYADTQLRDLAETYLWLDDIDQGLAILAALLRNDPGDIWIYNAIACGFGRFGLVDLGIAGAQRGLELIEATADPQNLRDQLLRALDDFQQAEERVPEGDLDPAVLADFRAALSLDFDAGEHRPIVELCRELVPDLDQVPVKSSPAKPDLPPPERWARRQERPPTRVKLGRNDPCWCGSGKKYKHCHWRSDRSR